MSNMWQILHVGTSPCFAGTTIWCQEWDSQDAPQAFKKCKVAEHSFSARALANAIQRAHKDGKKQTCRRYGDHFLCSMPALSVLFSS